MTPEGLRRVAEGLRRAGATVRLARPRPAERLDPALALLAAGLILAAGGTGLILSAAERSYGWFDPPLVRPAPDRRILADFRAGESPFVDAVMVDARTALIGRADGTLVRHDVASELLAEEALPRDGGLTGELALLARACAGLDVGDCPGAGEVMAVTERGGLARRDRAGRWTVLLSDAAWIGADGRPVEQEAVIDWAVSDDGRWVLALAGAQGLGLFDQQAGHWTILPAGGAAPRQVLFHAGAFWLAGAEGLDRLEPGAAGARRQRLVEGDIRDIAPLAGGLLALREAACERGRETCLSLVEVSPRGTLRRLAGEEERSPLLSNATLRHAALQAGRLVVLGVAGIHAYDPQARAWRVIEAAPVDAFHAGPQGAVIHAAAGLALHRIERGAIAATTRLETPLAQLLPVAGGGLVGLDTTGRVLDLRRTPPAVLVHADLGLPEGMRFTTAAAAGDLVAFLGPEGVLLHDAAGRRYAFQPGTELPEAVRRLATPRLLADEALWLVDMAAGEVFLARPEGDWPDRRLAFVRMGAEAGLAAPLEGAHAHGQALTVTDRHGRPFRLTAAGDPAQALTGDPPADAIAPRAVVGSPADLLIAERDRLWWYVLPDLPDAPSGRRWFRPIPGPGAPIAALARGEAPFVATEDGRLFVLGEQGWQPIAGASPAQIASAALTDARADDRSVWFAGDGRIQRYDPATRSFAETWQGGSGAVRLIETGRQPLWLSGGRLLRGGQVVSRRGETVLGAWPGPEGPVYLAREGRGRPYLSTLDGRCLFKGSEPPAGRLIEARALPDGRVLALTDRGAGLHEPAHRRWVALTGERSGEDTRLEVMGGHLLRRDGATLRTLPLGEIPAPESCDASAQRLPWRTTLRADHLSLNAADGSALLVQGGVVTEWRAGRVQELLPAASAAPRWRDLRVPTAAGGAWAFVAPDGVWRYDLSRRTWTSTGFAPRPRRPEALDLVVGPDGRARVTVWEEDGTTWGGEETGDSGTLTLVPLTLPALPQLDQPPAELRDLAQARGLVLALGEALLEVFRAADMTRQASLTLPPARAPVLGTLPGTDALVVMEGPAETLERLWVLPEPSALRGRRALTEVAWQYTPGDDLGWALEGTRRLWRIDRDLVLWRCDMRPGRRVPDGCARVADVPLALERGALRAALAEGGGWLILAGDRLLRLGADFRPRTELASGLGPEARLFAHAGAAHLWAGPRDALWRIEQERLQPVAETALALRRRGGLLVATTPEGSIVLGPDGRLVSEGLSALSVSAAGETWGMDAAAGLRGPDAAVAAEAGPFVTQALEPTPRAVLPGAVQLSDTAVQGFWLEGRDGALRFVHEGLCPAPVVEEATSPAPEALAPDDPGLHPGVEDVPPQDEAALEAPEPGGVAEGAEADSDGSADLDTAPEDTSPFAQGDQTTAPEAAPASEQQPEREPDPVPCLLSVGLDIRLAEGERLLEIVGSAAEPELVTTRQRLRIDPESGRIGRAEAVGELFPILPGEQDAHDRLGERIRPHVGANYLAPPVMTADPDGSLRLEGPVGPQILRPGRRIDRAAPFDIGWLRWDRGARLFVIGSGAAALRLTPAEAIAPDGRFVAVVPGRGAYLGAGRFAHLNSHGLWRVDRGEAIEPVAQAPFWPVQVVAQGRFLQPGRGMEAATGAIAADDDRVLLERDGLRLEGALRAGMIAATLVVGGQPRPVLAERGFLFDERRGVARLAGRPMLLTPVGLVPASGYSGAVPLPPDTGEIANADGALLLRRGAADWFALDPSSGLTPAEPPDATLLLGEADGRRWRRERGRALVEPVAAAEPFHTAGEGLDFATDRLVAAAATGSGIVAVTGIGTLAAARLSDLARSHAPLAPDPGAHVLDMLEVTPGQPVLWAETAAGHRVWDSAARQWRAPRAGEAPWADRLAVSGERLTVTFSAGQARAEVRMRRDGTDFWQPFTWRRDESLPFDRMRALWAEAGVLLAGTDLGLRRLRESGAGLIDEGLFATPGPVALSVSWVGRPEEAPELLRSFDAVGGCLEFPDARAAPRACPADARAGTRLLVDAPIWRWRQDAGVVSADYRLSDGRMLPITLPLRDGFPHDRVAERLICAGNEAERWLGAPVVAQLQGGVPGRLDPLEGVGSLFCQRRAAELGSGATLAPALIALADSAGWRSEPRGWQPLAPAEAAGAAERAEGRVPWEAGRLRLHLADGRPMGSYRSLDDRWLPLPWAEGRLTVDLTRGLAPGPGGWWRLTPAGLVGREGARRTQPFDPDRLRLVMPDPPGALADCRPDRIEAADGSVQALQAAPGSPVLTRCADGRLWQAALAPGSDRGRVQPLADDPFAERVLVEVPGFWSWRLRGAGPGQTGALAASFRGEPLTLSAGRFDADDWRGLATSFGDRVELLSASGWWRQPAGDWSLEAQRRPQGAEGIAQMADRLVADRDGAGRPVLCVGAGPRAQTFDAVLRPRTAESCTAWRGSDGLWAWRRGASGTLATAMAANGARAERRLEAGRFGDLIVTGAPTTDAEGAILAPTRLGALRLGGSRPRAIWMLPDAGAVFRDSEGRPVAMTVAGLAPLSDGPAAGAGRAEPACPALAELPARVPEGIRVRRVDRASLGVTVRLQQGGAPLDLLLPCAAIEASLVWAQSVDVSGRARFRAQGRDWPADSAELLLTADPGGASLRRADGLGLPLPALDGQAPRALLLPEEGRALLLLTRDDLFRIDTDRAIRELARGAGPLPPLRGPFLAPAAAGDVTEGPPVADTSPDPETDAPRATGTAGPDPAPTPAQAPLPAPSPSPPAPNAETDDAATQTEPVLTLDRDKTRRVQRRLAELGLYPANLIDGIVGPITRQAIADWQRVHGHLPTGALTEAQLRQLLAEDD